MHDPMTVAFEINWPSFTKERGRNLVTIWHVDPEKDGTDDSCGWFIRPRHANQDVLARIERRFEHDFDSVFKSESGTVYFTGMFCPNGEPHFTVPGVVLNLFFLAACEHFNSNGHTDWRKARRWMQDHLFDILLFAENPTDSLHDSLTRKFEIGCGEPYGDADREKRIKRLAGVIYSWILRADRPWWKHPRWHWWHWRIQVHPLLSFKRWAFSRCCKCGKGFRWGESPVSGSWHGTGPLWFRSESHVYHSSCSGDSRITQESASC